MPGVAPVMPNFRNIRYTFPCPVPGKLSTAIQLLSRKSLSPNPGPPLTGADHVAPSSTELNTWMPVPENINVDRYVLPNELSRASTGSPASPLGEVGKVPPSVHDVPPLVDREKPVTLLKVGEPYDP